MQAAEIVNSKSYEQGVGLYADAFGGGSFVNTEQEGSAVENQYSQKRVEEKSAMGDMNQGRENFEQQVAIERRNQLVHEDKPVMERKQPDALEAMAFQRQMDMINRSMQDSQME